MHKKNFGCLFVFLFFVTIAIAIYYFAERNESQTRSKQRAQEKAAKQDWEEKLKSFASRNNAVSDWLASVPNRDILGHPFTIDVSRALIMSNQQPVLLEAELKDVSERNGDIIAVFSADYFTNEIFLTLDLFLTCTSNQAEALMNKDNKNQQKVIMIAAKISSVSKPDFSATTSADDGQTSIGIDSEPNRLCCRGVFVDFMRDTVK